MARTIADNAAPGDGIIYCIAPGRLLVDYYTAHQHPSLAALPQVAYPDLPNFNQDPHSLEYLPRWNDDLLRTAAAREGRMWLIIHHDFFPTTLNARDHLKAILSERYRDFSEFRIDGVTIYLYSGHLPVGMPIPGAVTSSRVEQRVHRLRTAEHKESR